MVASYQKDTNKNKINLGIGAYQDNDGRPYVFKSVLEAEDKIREGSYDKVKSYLFRNIRIHLDSLPFELRLKNYFLGRIAL